MEILKQAKGWKLTKTSNLKYFKNGRANMHIEVRYHVEKIYTSIEQEMIERDQRVASGCFWIPTKKEALRIFNTLIKTGYLEGVPVKLGA